MKKVSSSLGGLTAPIIIVIVACLAIQIHKLHVRVKQQGNQDDHEDTSSSSASSFDGNDFQCNLYMAPSSIPNSGFGIFTTRDIKANEPVLHYNDVPDVVVTDVDAHSQDEDNDFWTHIDYLWSGDGLATFEGVSASNNALLMGCLLNYHTFLYNLHPYARTYDDTYLDRFENNPGVGAFSYHEGQTYTATRDINAGEELFGDYGEHWLDSRQGTFADFIPRKDDFYEAESVVHKIKENMEFEDLDLNDATLSTLVDIVNIFNPRAAIAMPKSAAIMNEVNFRSIAKSLAYKTTIERNVSWVKENGMCLELIRSRKSTIKQAGRGAFAQSFLKNGSTIVPVPLNTIADKNAMLMYDLVEDEETGDMVRKNDIPTGEQLIVNYCFGHTQSSLLLCPMTSAVLINHCSSRTVGEGDCNEKGPNAKITWAKDWDTNTPVWLKKSLAEIKEETALGNRGLSFNIVATRDIAPGEEIFIDYGTDWEKAWEDHVTNWEKPKFTTSYKPVRFMIDSRDFRSMHELESNPYPDNVQQVCYCVSCDDGEEYEDNDENETVVKEVDGSNIQSDDGVEGEGALFPCDIVEKTSEKQFTVRAYGKMNTYLITSYSSDLITFRMKQYTSDQHLKGAFRHAIGINDDMFPNHWKDLKDVATE